MDNETYHAIPLPDGTDRLLGDGILDGFEELSKLKGVESLAIVLEGHEKLNGPKSFVGAHLGGLRMVWMDQSLGVLRNSWIVYMC